MLAERNAFIDDIELSEINSLKHLMNIDASLETDDIDIIKHSSYYTVNEFASSRIAKGSLNLMSFKCQSINAKFNELELFINDINSISSMSVICL